MGGIVPLPQPHPIPIVYPVYFLLCSCRPYGPPFYGAVVAPFILTYITNWIIFIKVLHRLHALSRRARRSQLFSAALVMSQIFGLGWGIGLVATTSIPSVPVAAILQTLFVILVGFQGLYMVYRFRPKTKRCRRWCALTSLCHPSREIPTFIESIIKSSRLGYQPELNSSELETLSTSSSSSSSKSSSGISENNDCTEL